MSPDDGIPGPAESAGAPRIGVDEWVASVEEKRERYSGLRGVALREWTVCRPRRACFSAWGSPLSSRS